MAAVLDRFLKWNDYVWEGQRLRILISRSKKLLKSEKSEDENGDDGKGGGGDSGGGGSSSPSSVHSGKKPKLEHIP